MKKIMGFMMGWIVVATIVSVPVLSQDNFDESEPNNTYEDAAIVSVDRFEGSISEDDVHDWFFLENLERGLFIFTINYSPDRGDLDFAVFNNGIYVDAGISVDSQDSITCFIDGDCYAHI